MGESSRWYKGNEKANRGGYKRERAWIRQVTEGLKQVGKGYGDGENYPMEPEGDGQLRSQHWQQIFDHGMDPIFWKCGKDLETERHVTPSGKS